jgi:GDP-L-fucose synthase
VGGLFKNLQHKVQMFHDNLLINENILMNCQRLKVTKLVSCLSTCIFPDRPPAYPLTEEMLHAGPPHHSNEGYAYAKRMAEVQSRAYNEMNGEAKFVSVIPTNVFGSFDNFNLNSGHVLPALIHKFVAAARDHSPCVLIRGDGTPRRQFLFSQDLAALLVKVLNEYSENEPIILGPDPREELSVLQLAEKIARETGYQGAIHTELATSNNATVGASNGQMVKTASNAKLRKRWPDFQFTTLDTGIAHTVSWFRENYATARQ